MSHGSGEPGYAGPQSSTGAEDLHPCMEQWRRPRWTKPRQEYTWRSARTGRRRSHRIRGIANDVRRKAVSCLKGAGFWRRRRTRDRGHVPPNVSRKGHREWREKRRQNSVLAGKREGPLCVGAHGCDSGTGDSCGRDPQKKCQWQHRVFAHVLPHESCDDWRRERPGQMSVGAQEENSQRRTDMVSVLELNPTNAELNTRGGGQGGNPGGTRFYALEGWNRTPTVARQALFEGIELARASSQRRVTLALHRKFRISSPQSNNQFPDAIRAIGEGSGNAAWSRFQLLYIRIIRMYSKHPLLRRRRSANCTLRAVRLLFKPGDSRASPGLLHTIYPCLARPQLFKSQLGCAVSPEHDDCSTNTISIPERPSYTVSKHTIFNYSRSYLYRCAFDKFIYAFLVGHLSLFHGKLDSGRRHLKLTPILGSGICPPAVQQMAYLAGTEAVHPLIQRRQNLGPSGSTRLVRNGLRKTPSGEYRLLSRSIRASLLACNAESFPLYDGFNFRNLISDGLRSTLTLLTLPSRANHSYALSIQYLGRLLDFNSNYLLRPMCRSFLWAVWNNFYVSPSSLVRILIFQAFNIPNFSSQQLTSPSAFCAKGRFVYGNPTTYSATADRFGFTGASTLILLGNAGILWVLSFRSSYI
ncbi:hypothetical protein B0H16DRAFT_1476086 [Mycena metata]|uniref:Uncharacterized protein n=1 Tax=Mycena metata TaxID=1033252 RepID=A0AAD7HCB7_9AGAR|nr:hypothetical protein B0H16DRAFT_1476086 [Mycena metata]